jgi:hypothetical protein
MDIGNPGDVVGLPDARENLAFSIEKRYFPQRAMVKVILFFFWLAEESKFYDKTAFCERDRPVYAEKFLNLRLDHPIQFSIELNDRNPGMTPKEFGEEEHAVGGEAESNSVSPLNFTRALALSADFPEKIAAWRINLNEGVSLVINIDIAVWSLCYLAREGELSLGSRLTQDDDFLSL